MIALHPNLSRLVSTGAALKPWLVLGPLYENVSAVVPELSVYEAFVHGGGVDLMTEVAAQARGEPVQLHEYPLVDSPWAHSDFGSGCLTIRYHGQTHELYFNQQVCLLRVTKFNTEAQS